MNIKGEELMLIVFELALLVLVSTDFKLNYRRISPFTVIAIPYMFLILVNNLIAVRFGFFEIESSVQGMILGALACFFVGCIAARVFIAPKLKKNVVSNATSTSKLGKYNIDAIFRYCIIIICIEYVRVFYLITRHGLFYFLAEENEGLILTGILGHLLLTIYPLLPIVFYCWLDDKKEKKYLVVYILALGIFFLSFIKYHSIGLIVFTFIFVCLEQRDNLKKSIIILVVTVVGVFTLHYIVTFIYMGISKGVSSNFIIGHLWKYLAGSLIYDNIIFTRGLRVNLSEFYKIAHILFTLPNMFIRFITGNVLFGEIEETSFILVSSYGETGNVVDFIGYLFPSKGSVTSVVLFGIIMFLFGFIVNSIYVREIKISKRLLIPISEIMTFFCFFSFFGVYAGLIPPWEILVWSLVMPSVFLKKRKRIRIGSKSL